MEKREKNLIWTVKLNKKSEKELSKLDKQTQIKITNFLLELEKKSNPRESGRALKGDLGLFWRYRVGDYRIISQIKDDEIIILVLTIGHRKEVYR